MDFRFGVSSVVTAMRVFQLPPGWQADQKHHRLTRKHAIQNISLYLLLPSQDEYLIRLVRENSIYFTKAAKKLSKKIEREGTGKTLHREIASGRLYDAIAIGSEDDVCSVGGRISRLKTIQKWGIASGLLLVRLAQMSKTSNLREKHISLNRAIQLLIDDINNMPSRAKIDKHDELGDPESFREQKSLLREYPYNYDRIYLPASRKSLMQAWAFCRPSAHLWAAYVITLLGKKMPSSSDLNFFVGYSRWFEHFCITFQPLRSRSVLIAPDVMWHVPEDLGKMRAPALLELDRARATIIRQYSLFNIIDTKAAWADQAESDRD